MYKFLTLLIFSLCEICFEHFCEFTCISVMMGCLDCARASYLSKHSKEDLRSSYGIRSKKITNDQELIQSNPTSCPQNQKGNNLLHKLTAIYERHSR